MKPPVMSPMPAPRVPRLSRQAEQERARAYARFLNVDAGLPVDEACNMSGFDPRSEFETALPFVCAVAGVVLIIGAVVLS